jgi:CRP-like cAMP-binding protein
METLLQYIKEIVAVTPEDEKIITSYFHEKEVKKNENLLNQSQICRNLYFIKSGLLHTYYLHDGRIVSSWFYNENDIMTSWYSFLTQDPGYEFIQALEDSVVYSISQSDLLEVYRVVPSMERFGRILMEGQLAFIERFNKGYMFMSAKEKYDLLCEYVPDITLRVKLGLIASFLGISQETLSRIRAQK